MTSELSEMAALLECETFSESTEIQVRSETSIS